MAQVRHFADDFLRRLLVILWICHTAANEFSHQHTRSKLPIQPTISVHKPAAPASQWRRTRCGSQVSPGTDIITEWGKAITPDNVKSVFEYPRPQMTRAGYWHSLNGLWEFTASLNNCHGARNCDGERPPFGQTLNETILVPFPVESCLSGLENASAPGSPPTYQRMVYRTMVQTDGTLRAQRRQVSAGGGGSQVLLHFGAVDWQADVYVNGMWVGSHEGGYDGFTLPITEALDTPSPSPPPSHSHSPPLSHSASHSPSHSASHSPQPSHNYTEIMVVVHDPSNHGPQPFGKQRASAMWRPAGDTYSPTSGIWQPVWLEVVPTHHITALRMAPNTTHLNLNVLTSLPASPGMRVNVTVMDGERAVAMAVGYPNVPFAIEVPSPKLWSPEHPFLYNASVSLIGGEGASVSLIGGEGGDEVGTYFGMREVTVCTDPVSGVGRPCVNGKFRFLTGVLDQSFWSDGGYTAPGDAALASDLEAVKAMGQNFVRLHQKVNPERWYYHADRLGIMVANDAVQHYGDSVQGRGSAYQSNNGLSQARYYWHDLRALVDGRGNHPSLYQINTFNEQDMVMDFDTAGVVRWLKRYDRTRLVNADSGGPDNALHVGDVDDLHVVSPSLNNPHHPGPHQYAMDGEINWGQNFWVVGHTWTDGTNRSEVCRMYGSPDAKHPVEPTGTPHQSAQQVLSMLSAANASSSLLSVASYVCLHDTEMECDGLLSYDRTQKFSQEDLATIRAANIALIGQPRAGIVRETPRAGGWPQWLLGRH